MHHANNVFTIHKGLFYPPPPVKSLEEGKTTTLLYVPKISYKRYWSTKRTCAFSVKLINKRFNRVVDASQANLLKMALGLMMSF